MLLLLLYMTTTVPARLHPLFTLPFRKVLSHCWLCCTFNLQEKLFSSSNRTEISVGKKLKNDMLPEIEKVHKVGLVFLESTLIYSEFLQFDVYLFLQKKEKLLKKQHRQALMLDNMIHMDGLLTGRSLRDRKPVTYTFGWSNNYMFFM